jgi:hypothetical protein
VSDRRAFLFPAASVRESPHEPQHELLNRQPGSFKTKHPPKTLGFYFFVRLRLRPGLGLPKALKTHESLYFGRDHVDAVAFAGAAVLSSPFSTGVESVVDKFLSAQRSGVHRRAVSPASK